MSRFFSETHKDFLFSPTLRIQIIKMNLVTNTTNTFGQIFFLQLNKIVIIFWVCTKLWSVSSFEFWASSFEFRTSSFEFRASSYEFRTSSFEFRTSSFEFRASSFEFRTSSFEFRTSFVMIFYLPQIARTPLEKYGPWKKCLLFEEDIRDYICFKIKLKSQMNSKIIFDQ